MMKLKLPSFLRSASAFTAAAGGPTRVDTYLLNVQVENVSTGRLVNLGTFDKMTGGEVSSGATSYRPGGMGAPVSLGGQKVTSNVIVSRLYRLQRDHDLSQQFIDAVGQASMVVTKQPLDLTGVAYGRPIVFKGKLDRWKSPEPDSEASTAGLLELEMVVEGYPSS